MNIHEYQAKEIFRANGVPIPKGYLARSAVEAEFAYRRLRVPVSVVKAQIHAGGRGKAGGVKLVKSAEECAMVASQMIGTTLVTPQTGPGGKKVNTVYVEAGSDIAKEYYLALVLDRETATVAVMASTEGGMDIEEVAAKTPHKLIRTFIDPTCGIQGYNQRQITFGLGLDANTTPQMEELLKNLYKLFVRYDYSLLEINPLVLTKQGRFIALDGKMNFDENALFRHPEIEMLRDFDEEDAREVEASKFGLNYIGLEGNIGCLVNGAGLAMATMDIIKFHGGQPANFLDVGGGATEEMVRNAFRIILSDSAVKGVYVNIFGGIMRCDVIANGIVEAARALGLKVPVVVRLEGTNVEQGKKILAESGLNVISAADMADGASKVVKAVRG